MAKKRMTELDKLIEDVQGKHSKKMNAILMTAEDEDFAVAYFKILEYAAPKLQRREIVEKNKVSKVIIEHVQTTPEEFKKSQEEESNE